MLIRITLVVFCGIAFSLYGIAQTYEPVMGQDSTSFFIHTEIPDLAFSQEYKFIEKIELNNREYWISESNGWYNAGFVIREDTLNAKLWTLSSNSSDTTEYLIYDMNLMEGDTFYVSSDYSPSVATIVETIYYENDRKHIQFDLPLMWSPNDLKLTFIEGVGPNGAMLLNFNHSITYLNCMSKNGVEIYNESLDSENCDYYWTGIEGSRLHQFQIHSNFIANQELIIITDNPNSECQIIISSLGGSSLLSSDIYQTYQSINISSLHNGLYIATFLEDGKILKSEKLIIHN